jgi:hypothetical protein
MIIVILMEIARLIDIHLIIILEEEQEEAHFPLRRLTMKRDKIMSQVAKE